MQMTKWQAQTAQALAKWQGHYWALHEVFTRNPYDIETVSEIRARAADGLAASRLQMSPRMRHERVEHCSEHFRWSIGEAEGWIDVGDWNEREETRQLFDPFYRLFVFQSGDGQSTHYLVLQLRQTHEDEIVSSPEDDLYAFWFMEMVRALGLNETVVPASIRARGDQCSRLQPVPQLSACPEFASEEKAAEFARKMDSLMRKERGCACS